MTAAELIKKLETNPDKEVKIRCSDTAKGTDFVIPINHVIPYSGELGDWWEIENTEFTSEV